MKLCATQFLNPFNSNVNVVGGWFYKSTGVINILGEF